MDDSLTKFVRDKLDEGYSNQRIREILFDEGFLPSEIEQAFFEAEAIGKQPLEEGLTVRELKPEIPKVISEQEFIGEEKPDKPLVKEFKKGLSSFKVKKRGFKIKDNLGIGIVKTFKKFLPEKFITPKNRHLLVIAGLILAIIFLGGIGYVLYNNLSSRDPVSLIPEETDFYVRIKINSQNKQVQQFKDLIKKFPNYNLAEEKWAQAFEQINKENPIFEEVLRMFSKSSDLILATDTLSAAEPAKVLIILANPDLKELQKTKNDLEDFISQNNNWQMTKEKYRGKELVKIVYEGNLLPPELGLYYGSLSKQEIFSSFLGRNLILTNSFEEIKKVIDVFKSRGLANIFSSNKIKAITDNPAHKKLQKYLNKDYLVGYYIGLESLGIMQLTGANQFLTQNQDKAFINNFLKAAINLPLVASEAENKNNLSNQKRFALSSFFRVDENGLSSETYYLDSEKQIFLPAQFLLSESLANFLPEKIGIKEVVYYAESKDLNGLFQTLEQEAVKAMSPEQRIDYEETLVVLNEILGSDLKQEILPLFKSNFSFFVMAESDGREAPLVGIIFDIADENLVKSEILKVKIPKKILESFSGNMGDILSKKDDFVSFQKEIVDNFEIYSLPVIQEKQGGNLGIKFLA